MDIEPLWELGGWLLLSSSPTPPSISASKPRSRHLISLSLLIFFFLFLVLFTPSTPPTHRDNIHASSISIKRVLLESPSTTTTTTTNTLHPKPGRHDSKSKSKRSDYFGADEHEVPSGPNPISN
ncbi:CLAVATA3/ESR (CLE)-related protein TDIF [Linum perenne]